MILIISIYKKIKISNIQQSIGSIDKDFGNENDVKKLIVVLNHLKKNNIDLENLEVEKETGRDSNSRM